MLRRASKLDRLDLRIDLVSESIQCGNSQQQFASTLAWQDILDCLQKKRLHYLRVTITCRIAEKRYRRYSHPIAEMSVYSMSWFRDYAVHHGRSFRVEIQAHHADECIRLLSAHLAKIYCLFGFHGIPYHESRTTR